MKNSEKLVLSLSIALALMLGFLPFTYAMHIMEGYLPISYCLGWGAISIPFVVWGFISIRKTLEKDSRSITLLALAGAFVFVISSLKIPSVTGSCSHMTGTGLGALLFGAGAVSVLGLIVLVFQAILLAHGGLTTLGANTFSMAIAGPIFTVIIYGICKKLKVNKLVSVFIATALGDLFTYCVTSLQLALAYPSQVGGVAASLMKFLGVFATTQVPLAIIEGIISVLIIMALETYASKELKAVGYIKEA